VPEYPVTVKDGGGSVRLSGLICFPNSGPMPGARWYDGGGPPSDSYGEDGDYYLDDDDGTVYRKDGGTWA
jgi:uncharacterized protein YodC (DUF2158 family)